MELHSSQTGHVVRCGASLQGLTGTQIGEYIAAGTLGTGIHEVARALVDGSEYDAAALLTAWGDGDEADWWYLVGCLERMWGDLAVHFPDATAEQDLSRSLGGGDWLVGRCDVLSFDRDDSTVRILDWKSGRVEGDTLPQMLSYAAMALDENPWAERAYVCVAWLRDEVTDARWVTRAEADAWVDRLRDALRRSDQYQTGPHCQWCPRRTDCPALTAALIPLRDEAPDALLTRQNVQVVHGLRKALESRCRAVDAAVNAFVREHGPQVNEDGTVLGFKERKVETLEFAECLEWLMDTYPERFHEACSLSRGKVEQIIKDGAPRGEKRQAVQDALEHLRGIGAVTEKTTEVLSTWKESADE